MRGVRSVLLAGLALLGGLTACSGSSRATVDSTTTPTTDAPTAWGTIAAALQDGVPSKETALQAFSLVFGVKIPGVDAPTGSHADVPTSGTLVRDWVEHYRGQFEPAQQRAIDASRPAKATVQLTLGRGHPAEIARNVALPGPGKIRPAAVPTSTLVDAVQQEAEALVPQLAQRLGLPVDGSGFPDVSGLKRTMTTSFDEVIVSFLPPATGEDANVAMETHRIYNPGLNMWEAACSIDIYQGTWAPENGKTVILSTVFRVQLAHELVHCFQNLVRPDALSIGWISEGSATWAATDLLQTPEALTAAAWEKGWMLPEISLENRSYDAQGFWMLAQRAGRNLWPNFMSIWSHGDNAGTLAAVKADNGDLQSVWGPAYARRDDWSSSWTTTGVGLGDDARAKVTEVAVAKGGEWAENVEHHAALLHRMNVNDDMVTISMQGDGNGLYGVHDENGVEVVGAKQGRFCLKPSCVCPPGTRDAGKDLASTKLQQPFTLAYSGGSKGSGIVAKASDLKKACGDKDQPGDPGPCTGTCGRSNGDPHLRTLDGHPYDFQAAGEYVLVRDPATKLEIQARQEPLSRSDSVALNTAVAVGLDGHRFQLSAHDDATTITIDGQSTTVSDGQTRAWGAATVDGTARGPKLTLPDSTIVYVLVGQPEYGIQLVVAPSAALRAGARGLLGAVDPLSVHGLPPLADGTTPAGSSTRADAIYRQLGPSWLVDDRTSLFTYEAGRTSASYHRADFPRTVRGADATPLTDQERQRGEAACGGVTDADLRDACVFDVGVTGDDAFAASMTMVDDLQTDGEASLDEPVPSNSSPTGPVTTTPPVATGGLVALTRDVSVLHDAALADGRVYLSVVGRDGGAQLAAFDLPDGKVGPTLALPHLGRLAVADGSLWVDESDGSTCVLVRRDLTTLAERARVAVPNGCSFGLAFARGGDRVWVLGSTTDAAGTSTSVATPIDPTTNALGTPVPLPADGDSFARGGDYGVVTIDDKAYVIVATSSTPQPLASRSAVVGRRGVWQEGNGVVLRDASGATLAAFPDARGLRAAQGDVAFAAMDDVDGKPVLVALDATAKTTRVVARPPEPTTVGGDSLSFFVDTPLLVDDTTIVQLWLVGDGAERTVQALVVARR